MTQFNNELYAGFLPEAGDARFEGKRGFYPAMTAEEYRALPLPMKCATWDARVQYVIFDSYFRDYELSGKVEVHAENAFKALFRHSETDTQLYSVCAVRLFDGTRVAAKWVQKAFEEARGGVSDCFTYPSADRHSIFSRLHLRESGNPLRARAATVHGRRRERRRSRAIPFNGGYL